MIVDRRYHIQTINSAALRLLDIYRPAIGEDLVHVAERVPAQRLRRVIDAVFQPTPGGRIGPRRMRARVGMGRSPQWRRRRRMW